MNSFDWLGGLRSEQRHAIVVIEDESLDPGNVRFFGAERVVHETHNVADLIEQFSGGGAA